MKQHISLYRLSGKRESISNPNTILFSFFCVALLVMTPDVFNPVFASEVGGGDLNAVSQNVPTSIQITSIITNLVIRLAAIFAGVFVVRLGHDSLLKGVKGDFEFDGKWAKLKGSSPGLLFVLLGCIIIGWALQATHSGDRVTEITESIELTNQSETPDSTNADNSLDVPPPPEVPPPPIE